VQVKTPAQAVRIMKVKTIAQAYRECECKPVQVKTPAQAVGIMKVKTSARAAVMKIVQYISSLNVAPSR
jgi:hypothetical protein